ncbi:PQQ-dependent sugar dehydrogenase [Brooklawnia propionicigenes]|uniref:PQQ-dependent sugar dehydrogenase n=1 Tax=Brooklawnia propionicigenes TaxID=3041175 RepID=UPI0025726A21|nr:PQQ-dependent sugar dehydrogenase [Brooklawnia sp. SH051]
MTPMTVAGPRTRPIRRRSTARRARDLLVTAVAAVLLASCTVEPDPGIGTAATDATGTAAPGTTGSVSGAVEIISTGLAAPWSIAFLDDTPLVSERDSGRVLELDGEGNGREIATIAGVVARGEGGLLGIAVHDGYLYAYFTASGENRVERFELIGEPGSLSLGEAETILDGLPAAGVHNGGRIALGPDGMLYVTAGDANDRASAQSLDALSGKILRLTPSGDVPDDNPFAGSPVYSYGHRNPQGIAWDAEGTLYASEFGQNTWDELNIIEPGGNYGWPQVEGIAGQEAFIDPVQQWRPADASPSGIAIAGDTLYVANLRGQRLRAVPLADPSTATELLVGEYGRLRDAVAAPDGSIWVLTNNTDGRGRPAADDDRILRLPVA